MVLAAKEWHKTMQVSKCSNQVNQLVCPVPALLKLPNLRMRWPWSTGPLANACQIVRIQITSTPWHPANQGRCFIMKKNSKIYLRSCDSRNLNLNPLCTLENGPIPKLWMNQVKAFPNYCSNGNTCRIHVQLHRWKRYTGERPEPCCLIISRGCQTPIERSTTTPSLNCSQR